MDDPDYSHLSFKYIYRASALGSCLKSQAALQLGYSPVAVPDFFATLFKEGRLHEDAIISDIEESGIEVYDRELQVVLPVTKHIAVVGHIDGKLVRADGNRLLEMKTMADEPYKAFAKDKWETPGLIQKYKWQVSVYMLATGLPCTLVAKNKNNGRVVHEDIDQPFYSKAQIMARVLKMHGWVLAGELPEDCEQVDYPCPVYYLHEEADRDEDRPVEDVAAVREAAGKLRAARAVEAAAKEEARKAKDELIRVMGDEKKWEGIGSKYETSRSTVNWEKMREDGVEVEKYKEKGKKYWEVRLVKEGGDEDGE